MKRFFTVTSPTNALAVAVYAMLTVYGVGFLFAPVEVITVLPELWSTMWVIAASGALYAVLSAPRRRDPDTSLIIEFWASVLLFIEFVWFEVALLYHRTESGAFQVTTFTVVLIFVVAFGARAFQIHSDRKSLKQFRANEPPGKR